MEQYQNFSLNQKLEKTPNPHLLAHFVRYSIRISILF